MRKKLKRDENCIEEKKSGREMKMMKVDSKGNLYWVFPYFLRAVPICNSRFTKSVFSSSSQMAFSNRKTEMKEMKSYTISGQIP